MVSGKSKSKFDRIGDDGMSGVPRALLFPPLFLLCPPTFSLWPPALLLRPPEARIFKSWISGSIIHIREVRLEKKKGLRVSSTGGACLMFRLMDGSYATDCFGKQYVIPVLIDDGNL